MRRAVAVNLFLVFLGHRGHLFVGCEIRNLHRLSIRTRYELPYVGSVQVVIQSEIRRCHLNTGLEGHVAAAVVE